MAKRERKNALELKLQLELTRKDENMKYRFEIGKRLMGLNKYAGAKAKKEEQEYIVWGIKQQLGNIHIEKPVKGYFTWIEENKRRDLDNIGFAKKFILDALVQAGVLKDDNRRMVVNFEDRFEYADKSKVIVELEEV